MAITISIYNSFKEFMGDGTIDLDADTLKLALVQSAYTPSAAHTIFGDITNELTTANGYTAGGKSLTNVTWTRSGGTVVLDADNVAWANLGDPASVTFRYGVLYVNATRGGIVNPLIAWILFNDTPADVVVAAVNPWTVAWNAAGILAVS